MATRGKVGGSKPVSKKKWVPWPTPKKITKKPIGGKM